MSDSPPHTSDQSTYFRHMAERERLAAAKHGWFNWYVNRGRLPLSPTRADLRRLSWRRLK